MECLGLFRDAGHGAAGGDRRKEPSAAGNERTAYRAAVARLEANGIAVEFGANRERAEERLFDCFPAGFLTREWFADGMSPVIRPRVGRGSRPTVVGTIAASVSYKKTEAKC